MSELLARLQRDLNSARKARDKAKTLLLGTVLADVKNRAIELRHDLAEGEVVEVLRRAIKRRRESVTLYEQAHRADLASRERAEAEELEVYLPAGATDAAVRDAVRAAIAGGAANVGAVMARVMPELKGRAEGSRINAIAREELSKQA